MKVEFYEETTVQKKQRFIADDGTIFDSEGECMAYEDRRKLDDMPYPQTISVPVPLEEYDVNISLLKSPLDFKKLLTEYEDYPASMQWDLYDMDKPATYPCLYTYYVDGANRTAASLTTSPAELIRQYDDAVRKLSIWCAQQLEATP